MSHPIPWTDQMGIGEPTFQGFREKGHIVGVQLLAGAFLLPSSVSACTYVAEGGVMSLPDGACFGRPGLAQGAPQPLGNSGQTPGAHLGQSLLLLGTRFQSET